MEKRSLFDRIFGRFRRPPRQYRAFELLSGNNTLSTWLPRDPYASDVARTAIHTIASQAAKLRPIHIRRTPQGIAEQNSQIARILQLEPNPYMNGYDFLYRVVTILLEQNNVFILPIWDEEGNLVELYPIPKSAVTLHDVQGDLLVEFDFVGGKHAFVPYGELIHLRRHYNKNDIFGESNAGPLLTTLELLHTTDQGIKNAVRSSAKLRGILRFTQSMLKPDDIKKERDRFVQDYLTLNNDGGVAALDAKAEYIPLDHEPKLVNAAQMQYIEDKVYKYFGLSRAIVQNDYKEDQWSAFYEGVLEPLAIQLSLEFTRKLFTPREIGHGNEVVFQADRLQHASMSSKLALVSMVDRGALTPNEWREVLNLPPIDGGDDPIRRLDTRPTVQTDSEEGGDGDADSGASEQ